MQQRESVSSAAPIPSKAGKREVETGNGNKESFLKIINFGKRIIRAGKDLLDGVPVPGHGVLVFRCRTCKGSGRVLNPWFEICTESGFDRGEIACHSCNYRHDCGRGEEIPCTQCFDGYMVVRLSEFELVRSVA